MRGIDGPRRRMEIDDVRIVLNPNTLASVERFAPTLAIRDGRG